MKKHIVAAVVAAVVLLVFAYLGLQVLVNAFPALAEEYYYPAFKQGSNNAILYYLHPVVLSFMLAWFWDRFKPQFRGTAVWRGIELGLVYGLIAIVPAMLLNFSALNVSLSLILMWLVYGILQGVIAGIVFAMMDP